MDEVEELWQKLEETGEEEVRQRLNSGLYDRSKKAPHVKAWLQKKADERLADQQKRQEERENKALQIANDANEISRRANRIALWAFLVAAVSVVISLIAIINK